MTARPFLGLLLLMIVSIPVARVVASPRWNPLPICIVMPVLGAVVVHDHQRPMRWLAVVGFIVIGASVGVGLTIGILVLDVFGRVFPTPGFQFGTTYYGWDTVYTPASAYVGSVTTLVLLRSFHQRRLKPEVGGLREDSDRA